MEHLFNAQSLNYCRTIKKMSPKQSTSNMKLTNVSIVVFQIIYIFVRLWANDSFVEDLNLTKKIYIYILSRIVKIAKTVRKLSLNKLFYTYRNYKSVDNNIT